MRKIVYSVCVIGISLVSSSLRANGFYISLPFGVQTVRSSAVNSVLESRGVRKITDLTTSISGVGLGYEWMSGFRFFFEGGQGSLVDESENTDFINYQIAKGGLGVEFPIMGSGSHFLFLGTTLGASLSRFIIISDSLSGVGQDIEVNIEPSLSYQYGGKSVRITIEASYAQFLGEEYKNFGNPGISALDGPRFGFNLGLLFYL